MAEERNSWIEIFQSLGQAMVSVLKEELEVLAKQWKQWGTRLGVVLGLFAVSAVVLASAILLLPYFLTALVQYFSGWSWAASSGLVLGVVVLIASVFGAIGYLRLRGLDDPVNMTRQRLDDHVVWWRSSILETRPQLDEGGDDDREEE